ncbi:MAG: hypothetical protein IPJ69_05555 [Deltaproteobacteria bacterium]|nr:MAG: hypothetical protein IPJ69_05555 [Deltaproteobacteria bacterium]
MVLSFAEIIVFVGILCGVYFALRPLQKWMEAKILKVLRKSSRSHVTLLSDYSNQNHQNQKKDYQEKE